MSYRVKYLRYLQGLDGGDRLGVRFPHHHRMCHYLPVGSPAERGLGHDNNVGDSRKGRLYVKTSLRRELRQLDVEKALTRTPTSPLESPDADLLEPSYKESVRRFKQRQRMAHFDQWRKFHLNMRELHLRLADEHQHKADTLERLS
jgi:hypothetical protein